jgi:hypothetical protein
VSGTWDHSNTFSGPIKISACLNQLSDYFDSYEELRSMELISHVTDGLRLLLSAIIPNPVTTAGKAKKR